MLRSSGTSSEVSKSMEQRQADVAKITGQLALKVGAVPALDEACAAFVATGACTNTVLDIPSHPTLIHVQLRGKVNHQSIVLFMKRG